MPPRLSSSRSFAHLEGGSDLGRQLSCRLCIPFRWTCGDEALKRVDELAVAVAQAIDRELDATCSLGLRQLGHQIRPSGRCMPQKVISIQQRKLVVCEWCKHGSNLSDCSRR